MVAIVVALAVPVSQLRVISIIRTCCCPVASDCHCPGSKAPSGHPSMQACHNSEHVAVAPQLPSFDAPVVAIAAVPAIAIRVTAPALSVPHAAPPPIRPDAPS
jgi:hypothetical protein